MVRPNGWQIIGVILLTVVGLVLLRFLLGSVPLPYVIILPVAAWLVAYVAAWGVRRLDPRLWIAAGLVILAALFLPASAILAIPFGDSYQPSDSQTTYTLYLTTMPALVIVALLTYSLVTSFDEHAAKDIDPRAGSHRQPRLADRARPVALILAAALVAAVIYHYYWFIVWDNTGDSLGMLWLIFPSLAIVFGAGLLLALLRGKWKPAGALYLFLIPILFAVSARAQAVDFRQLTDARAAQTSSAVDSYYAREGHYPQELGQLFPRDALSLGGPVILYGQDWCYDGGRDYYRLGYVYHEHWSDPRLFGQLYKSQGQTPELPPLCAAEISALAKRYPFFTAHR